jgi:hypothetical protein
LPASCGSLIWAKARERGDKIGKNRIDAEARAQKHPGHGCGRVGNLRGLSALVFDISEVAHYEASRVSDCNMAIRLGRCFAANSREAAGRISPEAFGFNLTMRTTGFPRRSSRSPLKHSRLLIWTEQLACCRSAEKSLCRAIVDRLFGLNPVRSLIPSQGIEPPGFSLRG